VALHNYAVFQLMGARPPSSSSGLSESVNNPTYDHMPGNGELGSDITILATKTGDSGAKYIVFVPCGVLATLVDPYRLADLGSEDDMQRKSTDSHHQTAEA
jgi:hypothetical protein